MGRISAILALGLGTLALGQQGGNQGPYQGQSDGSVQTVERGISAYLRGEEIKSVLTPGETVDWELKLKAGQVVVGEARSDAFDPGLQIVDDKNAVLATNDDRYPGDQRPLILWRCEHDGTYFVRVRCFRDKSGGQVFVRFHTYDTVDAPGGVAEKEMPSDRPFLLRVPMKAGQFKQVVAQSGGDQNSMSFSYNEAIAPNGLPDIKLSVRLQPAIYGLLAPVDGDYYIMYTPNDSNGGRRKVRVDVREIVPAKLDKVGTVEAPTGAPALAELSVKAGDLLEASTPELDLDSRLVLAEAPDVSKYDLAKPESNPFFPHPLPTDVGPAFDLLPARARDGRITVFRARRDARLFVASNGAGPEKKRFTLRIRPAASELAEDKPNVGSLKVAKYDHWAFDAKAGDVMTLASSSPQFDEVVVVRDPDLMEIRHEVTPLDGVSQAWTMIVQKPGRYLVTVSCLGDGGSGGYTLSRKGFHAQEFGISNPAKGEISNGQIQVWKFTATPDKPLLVRWRSTAGTYTVAIYDEKGSETDFQREEIDPRTTLGILKVDKPQTYVIVLTGTGAKAGYSIELEGIPTGKG